MGFQAEPSRLVLFIEMVNLFLHQAIVPTRIKTASVLPVPKSSTARGLDEI